MKRMLLLAAAIGVWPAAVALAQAPAAQPGKPDLARAQTIVNQVCAACHGTDGNSPTPVNPSLAGQGAEYITLQLSHFKSGVRANPVMLGMASTLTADEMKALGVYFSQQKPKGLAAKDAALARTGQKLYRGGDAATGLPACAACHGPAGAGIPKQYPRLSGQHADYAYAQLKAFKAGERGADKDGKDVNGRIMAAVAARMTDAQMKALADYTAGLR
jgi:cytochrome c553